MREEIRDKREEELLIILTAKSTFYFIFRRKSTEKGLKTPVNSVYNALVNHLKTPKQHAKTAKSLPLRDNQSMLFTMYKTILFLALASASAFLSETHAAALDAAPDDDLKDQYNPVLTAVTSQSIAADGRPKVDNG